MIFTNNTGNLKNQKISKDLSKIIDKENNMSNLIESSTENLKNNKFTNINYNFSSSTCSKDNDLLIKNPENENIYDFEMDTEGKIEDYMLNLLENSV